MHYFCDPHIDAIFDVSGGDLANEVLPELDYQVAAQSRATFWGYSDVTTVINALHTRAGKASVLYRPAICRFARPVGPNGSAGFAPAKKVCLHRK